MKTTEHKETGEKMDIYEMSYLILPTVPENSVTEEVTAIRGLLDAAGASVISEDFPKLRDLAYTMEKSIETKNQKYKEAYFGWIKFELPVAQIADIKTGIEKRANVLRHLIIKTVRENTMYRAPEEEEEKTEGAEASAPEAVPAEGEVKKGIDSSIDALVAN